MSEQPGDKENLPVKLAFEAHMEHYKATRTEIIHWSNSQNNLVNYSIAVIGGSVVLFSIQTNQGNPLLAEYPFILMVISFLLSMITWAALEAEIHIHDMLEYSDKVLHKKVQKLIGDDLPPEFQVLRTDIAEISKRQTGRAIFRGILVSGKFLVAYLPAVAFLLLYLISFPTRADAPWYVHVLSGLTIIAVMVVPVALVMQVMSVSRHYWGRDEAAKVTRQKPPRRGEGSKKA